MHVDHRIEQQLQWVHDIEGDRDDYAEYRDPFTFLCGTRCLWVRYSAETRQIGVPKYYGGRVAERQRRISNPALRRIIEPGLSVFYACPAED